MTTAATPLAKLEAQLAAQRRAFARGAPAVDSSAAHQLRAGLTTVANVRQVGAATPGDVPA
jgi:hypothetical protein